MAIGGLLLRASDLELETSKWERPREDLGVVEGSSGIEGMNSGRLNVAEDVFEKTRYGESFGLVGIRV